MYNMYVHAHACMCAVPDDNRMIFLMDIAVYTVFAFFKHKNIENLLITFQEIIFGPLCQ